VRKVITSRQQSVTSPEPPNSTSTSPMLRWVMGILAGVIDAVSAPLILDGLRGGGELAPTVVITNPGSGARVDQASLVAGRYVIQAQAKLQEYVDDVSQGSAPGLELLPGGSVRLDTETVTRG
jgi:hypothetical protein